MFAEDTTNKKSGDDAIVKTINDFETMWDGFDDLFN